MTNETAEQLREEIAGLFDSAFESGLNKNVPPLGRDEAANESADISINKVLDAAWPDIKIMQQAMFEMKHAQLSGPGWYTRGEPGLKQQVRMWIDKGLKASESINKLRP